jgi:hypothetical protein
VKKLVQGMSGHEESVFDTSVSYRSVSNTMVSEIHLNVIPGVAVVDLSAVRRG